MAKDPLFVAYAKSAPREDLRAYVNYGRRKLATYDLSPRAIEVLGRMCRLLPVLETRDGTPADKRAVWALVDSFKSAIPGYARLVFEVKTRRRPLQPAAVEKLIAATAPPDVVKVAAPIKLVPRSAPRQVVSVPHSTCPTCGAPLRAAKASQPRPTATPTGRAAVDWAAAGRKAWETRQRRLAEAAAAIAAAAAAAAKPTRKRATR